MCVLYESTEHAWGTINTSGEKYRPSRLAPLFVQGAMSDNGQVARKSNRSVAPDIQSRDDWDPVRLGVMMTTKRKQKVDHEPVRAMAETPRKIYQEVRQNAAALQKWYKKTVGRPTAKKPRREPRVGARP